MLHHAFVSIIDLTDYEFMTNLQLDSKFNSTSMTVKYIDLLLHKVSAMATDFEGTHKGKINVTYDYVIGLTSRSEKFEDGTSGRYILSLVTDNVAEGTETATKSLNHCFAFSRIYIRGIFNRCKHLVI